MLGLGSTPGALRAAREHTRRTTRMAKKRDGSGKRGGERRPPMGGSNLVWSLIAAAVAGLFALSLLGTTPEVELSYSDLEKLIRVTGRADADPTAGSRFIEVPRRSDLPGQVARYADLKDVTIGAFQVTGTVRELPLSGTDGAQPGGPQERLAPAGGLRRFRSAKLPSENSEGALSKLLAEHGVPFRYEEPPSPWRNWMPMLFITGLFGLFFWMMLRRVGGAGSPMAFGRSRGKMYAQEIGRAHV